MATRRNKKNRDLESNVYETESKGHKYYVWEHPITHIRERLGRDRAAANSTGRALNAALTQMGIPHDERAKKNTGMTVAQLAKEYFPRAIESRGSHASIKKLTNIYERIGEVYTDVSILRATVKDLFDPIGELPNSSYNDIRFQLIRLFAYALSRGYIPHNVGNAAAVMEKRSTAKAKRMRLTYDAYQLIFTEAEPWLQTTMAIMLHTGLRPCDVVHLRYDQVIDGVLYTKVRKTGKFLGIELFEGEHEIIKQSRYDGVISPYIVHRAPKRHGVKKARERHHSTQVTTDLLSREFSAIRDKLGIGAGTGKNKRGTPPTLYEIRSLSGRLYAEMGREKKLISDLFAHTKLTMTDVYLDERDISREKIKMVRAGLQIGHIKS